MMSNLLRASLRFLCRWACAAALFVVACPPLAAQEQASSAMPQLEESNQYELRLASGGTLEGRWLNHQDIYATHYELEIAAGRLRIARDQVLDHRRVEPARDEYLRIAPTYGDSIEEQLALAEWCQEHDLPAQRALHLRHILTLDPHHTAARAGLGYTYVDGRWILPRRGRERMGLVRDGGRWRLPQAVELDAQRREEERLARERLAQVRRWREHIVEDGDDDACQALLTAADPLLVPSIAICYAEEPYWPMRALYVEALYQVAEASELNVASVELLAQVAVEEPHEEVRWAAVEALERVQSHAALEPLVEALASNDNAVVNRAAIALGRLGDGSAIEPLIDRLVSTHQIFVPGTEATTAVFGRGEGGATNQFRTGRADQFFSQTVRNQEVLRALVRLSGVSYGFDADSWRTWLEIQKAADSPTIQSRRD